MHPDLPLLVELQSVDLEIARLNKDIAARPAHVAEIEKRLQSHIDQLESDKKTLADHYKDRKESEREIAAIKEKISKYRDQMTSVKNNEQYKALQHEIDFAEEGIKTHEGRIIEKMVLDEDLEKAVKTAKARLDAEKAEVDKEKSVVAKSTADDQSVVDVRGKYRAEVAAKISEKNYSEYTRLSRKPPAVAIVRGGTCTACRVKLRPQWMNEVRSNRDIKYCESCKRILFHEAPAPPPEFATAG